jgi:hypothetical protein
VKHTLGFGERREAVFGAIGDIYYAKNPSKLADDLKHLGKLLTGGESSNLPLWQVLSVAQSHDVPNQVSWAASQDDEGDNSKRKRAKWGKFLSKFNHEGGWQFNDSELQAMAQALGEYSWPGVTAEYDFEIVWGQEIQTTYNEQYFGSCMHNSDAVQLYAKNPQTVKMLRITKGGDLCGRALLWQVATDPDGDPTVTFLDRIYPSSGAHCDAAQEYAHEQGWDFKGSGAGSYYYASMKDVGAYPYVDSLCYMMDRGDSFILTNNCGYGDYELRSTGNEDPREGSSCCEDCGARMRDDDAIYIENHGDVCESCYGDNYGRCYGCGELYHTDDLTYTGDDDWCNSCRDETFVYSERNGEWIRQDDAVYLEYLDDHVLLDDVVTSECADEVLLNDDAVHSDVLNDYIPERDAIWCNIRADWFYKPNAVLLACKWFDESELAVNDEGDWIIVADEVTSEYHGV